ncbi:MAG: isoprenylcysteine carboxylmethyltransferase family protein [Anaerolineae bacterium]|jgi:protein-S-isoprenylcysteine O-methyltransferase Ste14
MRILRSLGYLVTTLVMYLGIPLLGWGLFDLRRFLSLGPRLACALVVLALGLSVGWQAFRSPEGTSGGSGREESRISRQSVVRVIVIALMYVALLFLPFADRRKIGVLMGTLWARWVGVVVFSLGVGLVFWSGVALGRLYSGHVTLQEDHHLITDGPYRYVRHPRYTGAVLLAFGLALTFRSWVGLVGSTAFIGIILFRITDEEALMKEAFGREWDAYCKETRRLIPFIY